jgi:Skp family chaperone for outer membrane proteins
MRNINKILGLLIVVAIFPSFTYAEEKFKSKIAVVDVESILEHSTATQYIRKSINEISTRIQAEMSAKELNLKNIEGDLIKQRGILSEADFESRVAEFNKQVSETQKEMQIKKSSLEQAHGEAMATVHQTTIEIIGDLAKKHDFNLVLPSSQVLFVDNELNITLEVITNLNNRLKTVEVNYHK